MARPQASDTSLGLGATIRAARTAAGWSQRQLAARLDVRQPAVNQWELELTEPSLRRFIQLAGLLGPSLLAVVTAAIRAAAADSDADAAGVPAFGQRVPPPSPQELARLVGEGHNDQTLARRYGVPPRTVLGWRKASGIRLPARPPLDEARLVALYQRGVPAATIAAQVGCSEARVWGVLRRRGVRREAAEPAALPATSELVALYKAGWTVQEIADHHGRSYSLVRARLTADPTVRMRPAGPRVSGHRAEPDRSTEASSGPP